MRKLNEYGQRISNFQKVKSALQVVEKAATISFQVLRHKAPALENYSESLKQVLGRLSNFYIDNNNPLFISNKSGKRVLYIVAGNKGIVGDLYYNLVSEIALHNNNYDQLFTSSKKLRRYLHDEKINAALMFPELCESDSSDVIDTAINWCVENFKKGDFKKLDLMFQQYVNLSEHVPSIISFLPLNFAFKSVSEAKEPLGFPVFEPRKKHIFSMLSDMFAKSFFYSAVYEARLSEAAARTLGAHSAVSKTEELVQKLRLEFLKARKRIVTQRQLQSFIVRVLEQ